MIMNRNLIPRSLSVAFLALLHLLVSSVSSRAEVTHELVASFKYVPHSLNRESLTLGPDGNLWATVASSKGEFARIYKMKGDGADWIPLGQMPDFFSNPLVGPISKLVSDGKGSLWGVSADGGGFGMGMVFTVDSAGLAGAVV